MSDKPEVPPAVEPGSAYVPYVLDAAGVATRALRDGFPEMFNAQQLRTMESGYRGIIGSLEDQLSQAKVKIEYLNDVVDELEGEGQY